MSRRAMVDSAGCGEAHPVGCPDGEEFCSNCGTPLHGPYCFACGQEAGDLDRSFGRFLVDFLRDVVDLDSRVWRTMIPLLIRPGEVTVRYLEGQRARFVPPVRLYLFVTLVYFLMITWLSPGMTGDLSAGISGTDGPGFSPWSLPEPPPGTTRLFTGLEEAVADPEGFRRSVVQGLSYLMFFLVPLFGALVHLAHRRRGRYYLHHLLFAVHFHVAIFLILSIALVVELPGWNLLDRASDLLRLAIPVHLFFSLRKVYGGRKWVVLLRTAFLSAGYLLILVPSLAVLFVVLLT